MSRRTAPWVSERNKRERTWERAWEHATGPRTVEGKKAVSAGRLVDGSMAGGFKAAKRWLRGLQALLNRLEPKQRKV